MRDLVYLDYNDIDLVIDTSENTDNVLHSLGDSGVTLETKPTPRVDVFFKSGQKVTLSGGQAREILNHYANRNE